MSSKSEIIRVLKEAFQRETDSFEFYRKAGSSSGEADVEALFIQLAEEERKHRIFLRQELSRIEAMMDSGVDANRIDADAVRFLPPADIPFRDMKSLPGIDISAVGLPGEMFGGDWVDSFVIRNDGQTPLLGFYLYDVMGHGIEATRLKAEARKALGMFRERGLEGRGGVDLRRPGQVLTELNRLLIRECMGLRRFVSMFYGVVDPSSRNLVYASAGHEPPLVLGSADDASLLDETELLIGIDRNVHYIDRERTLTPDGVLVLYSDGLTEAVHPDKGMFGRERVCEAAVLHRIRNAENILERIMASLVSFLEGHPVDDELTLAVMKMQP